MAEENIKQHKKEESKPAVEKSAEIKKEEKKESLEREYTIPLRKRAIKAPRYKRAKKAIRIIKEFLAKHMKVENRDLRKIKINKYLNQQVWERGIRNPPSKIKVKVVKRDGIVYAELAEIPDKVKWEMEREKRKLEKVDKKKLKEVAKKEEAESDVKEERAKGEIKEESSEGKEKEKASVEAGLKEQKREARSEKHTSKPKSAKQLQIKRKAMKR